MPRTGPQNTRRLLKSAMNHIDKAITQINKVFPWDQDPEDWDERYKDLVKQNVALIRVYEYFEDLLGLKERTEEENKGKED